MLTVATVPQGSGSDSEGEEEHKHVHHHGPRLGHHPAKPVKKAAAALSVGVGSLSDPWDLQVRNRAAAEPLDVDSACMKAATMAGGLALQVIPCA